jgi:hypothetical protein
MSDLLVPNYPSGFSQGSARRRSEKSSGGSPESIPSCNLSPPTPCPQRRFLWKPIPTA